MRVRFPLLAPRHDHAVVAQWQSPSVPSSGRGFDSPSPLSLFVYLEPDLWRGARSAKPCARVRFPAGSPAHDRFFSACHVPILLDGPGSQILNLETRVRIPLGTPGRFADLWPSSGRHASAVEPTNSIAQRCSLCPGGRASGYELDWRGSTPRREANPSAPRSHARRPAPVLVARDTSLRSLSPRFDSWQGRRRKGRSHPGFIPPALQVQFLLLHPAAPRGERRLS